MTIVCNVCGYDQNPNDTDFCDACGAELNTATSAPPQTAPQIPLPPITPSIPPPQPTVVSSPPNIPTPPVNPSIPNPQPAVVSSSSPTLSPQPPITPTIPSTVSASSTARLISKQTNQEFPLEGYATIGIFDPDTGPVDIDLETFAGNETISRQHAEIYQEAGVWKIKDLGSTNGVFIKPAGQNRFNARITMPETINSGDEIAFAKIRFLFQIP
jgi:hypothetical protein